MFCAEFSWLTPRLYAAFFAASAMLLGCGPEAPPCNDTETTHSVLGMVSEANDAHLQGYPAKSSELASFALETPTVTSYDDKLKLRSCKTTIVMTLKPAKLAQMNEFLANPMPNLLGALMTLSGRKSELYPQEVRDEVAYVQARSNGPVRADPIRKSLAYQIVKQEGSNEFVVTTNVSVDGTIQYLRVAAAAEQWSVARAQAAQTAQTAQAAPVQQAHQAQAQSTAEAANPNLQPAPPGDRPTNFLSVIDHFEMCGEEALCLYTTAGHTVSMNMAVLEDRHYALLRHSAQDHTPICLRDVIRDGPMYIAEDLAERC